MLEKPSTRMLASVILVLMLQSAQSSQTVFKVRRHRATVSVPNLQGTLTSGYYISIKLGTPPQQFNVILDTGSSNFAIAGSPDVDTSSFFLQSSSTSAESLDSSEITISYTKGSWKGYLIKDKLSIASAGLDTPVYVPLAVIKSSEGFFVSKSNWEGILGLGYAELAQPQSLHLNSVMESIVLQSKNISDMFSMQLCAVPQSEGTQGSFIIGASDSSLAKGPFEWTRIVRKWYYDVVISAISIGGQYLDFNCKEFNRDRTIIDSGTTNLRFPTIIYNEVVKLISENVKNNLFGSQFYSAGDMYCNTNIAEVYTWFPNITLYFPSAQGNRTFALVIYPQNYLQYLESAGQTCVKFAIFSSETGTVLGTVLMEQYYVIFDRANERMGFALSSCAFLPIGSSTAVFAQSGYINTTVCKYQQGSKVSPMRFAAYVLLGLLCVCFIPIAVLMVINCYRNNKLCCKPREDYESDTTDLLTNY